MRRSLPAALTVLVMATCVALVAAPGALSARPLPPYVTDIAVYSDGLSSGSCFFHIVVTYTGTAKHNTTVTWGIFNTSAFTATVGQNSVALGSSPWTSNSVGTTAALSGTYRTDVTIEGGGGKLITSVSTPHFLITGCPAAGLLVEGVVS